MCEMGLLGAMCACPKSHATGRIKCSQLWVTPELINRVEGWWWLLDVSAVLNEGDPSSIRTKQRVWAQSSDLDLLIGHYFVYENGPVKVVWRIVKVDESRTMLLGKWPD